MARIHLFEFEDLKGFPTNIRNYMTDFLQFTANKFDFYKTIIPVLKKGIDAANSSTIVDLASGGGGGWEKLSIHLQEELPEVKVHLTDFYPNLAAFQRTARVNPSFFSFSSTSVNALDVPKEFHGKLRTQFLSFHHFTPDDGLKIIQNAVDTKSPIAIFEAQKRSVGDFLKFFFSPINVLLLTPFIKPFSVGRIFFTYLFPLVPLFVWWDGLVSVVRTYSASEMHALISKTKNNASYDWEVDYVKNGPIKIYYVLGTPKSFLAHQ